MDHFERKEHGIGSTQSDSAVRDASFMISEEKELDAETYNHVLEVGNPSELEL